MQEIHSPILTGLHQAGPTGGRYLWRPIADQPRNVVRRGALAAAGEPTEIFRHGYPLDLSDTEAAIVSSLVRRGRASYADLHATLGSGCSAKSTLEVFIHRVRRKFAAQGAPDPIKTVRNWGLSLRVEPDRHGSTALWIGDVVA
jgi:DNA-binding response OmpR family regulator